MHASAFGQIKTVYNECMTILMSPDLSSTNYLLTISLTKKKPEPLSILRGFALSQLSPALITNKKSHLYKVAPF